MDHLPFPSDFRGSLYSRGRALILLIMNKNKNMERRKKKGQIMIQSSPAYDPENHNAQRVLVSCIQLTKIESLYLLDISRYLIMSRAPHRIYLVH